MNDFKLMADGYRMLAEKGKISQEDADKEIAIYDFLGKCSQADFYRLFNSGAFNGIIDMYVHQALVRTMVDTELELDTIERVRGELRRLLDEKQAGEICE